MPILPPDTGGGGGGSTTSAIREFLLLGRSTTPAQEPVAVDSPLQVDFGPAQGTGSTPLSLAANGAVTVNESGTYYFDGIFPVGRTGAAGTSEIFIRLLVNGVQAGGSIYSKLSNSDVTTPLAFSIFSTLTAGDIVTVEILRDSSGNDSGGLLLANPVLGDWNPSGSAVLTMSRLIPAFASGDTTPQRSNHILVKVKSDFPAPIGGIITLVDNSDYEINGPINLGTDRIVLTGSNNIYGLNPELDNLITNNPTSLVEGRDAGVICNNVAFVNTGGQIFDIQDTAGNEGTNNAFISECLFINSESIGTFTNLLAVQISKNLLRGMSGGARFVGSAGEAIRIDSNIVESSTTGTIIDLGTATFGAVSIDHNYLQASAGVVFLSGLTDSGNIDVDGHGSVISNISFGSNIGTVAIEGVSFKDLRWSFDNNNTIPDSDSIGSLYMASGNTEETPLTGGVPAKVIGATVAGENIQRYSMPEENRLMALSGKVTNSTVTYIASVNRNGGSGTRLVTLTIYKNGSPLVGASQSFEVDQRPRSASVLVDVVVLEGDYFELWITNEDNNNNMIVTSMQCSIR